MKILWNSDSSAPNTAGHSSAQPCACGLWPRSAPMRQRGSLNRDVWPFTDSVCQACCKAWSAESADAHGHWGCDLHLVMREEALCVPGLHPSPRRLLSSRALHLLSPLFILMPVSARLSWAFMNAKRTWLRVQKPQPCDLRYPSQPLWPQVSSLVKWVINEVHFLGWLWGLNQGTCAVRRHQRTFSRRLFLWEAGE